MQRRHPEPLPSHAQTRSLFPHLQTNMHKSDLDECTETSEAISKSLDIDAIEYSHS